MANQSFDQNGKGLDRLRQLARPILYAFEETGMSRPVARMIDMMCPQFIRIHGYQISNEGLAAKVKGALFWGFYEAAELVFVQRDLLPDLDVVELGASIGVNACHILSRIKPSNRLICVEANPNLIATARKNITTNHPGREFELLNCAVAYGGHTVRFQEGMTNLSGHVSSIGREVPAITLAALLGKYNIRDYVLICDVEGAEAEILQNDSAALSRCRQMIIDLTDTATVSSYETLALLTEKIGFSISAQYHPVYSLLKDPGISSQT